MKLEIGNFTRCKCQAEIKAAVEKENPGFNYVLQQVDLLTGRTFTDGVLKKHPSGKSKNLFAAHTYCPWCGKAYK